ncbi:MAG: ABC transporter ATP-binding protein [Candidatus Riflebacteria bacterium HGW-Riflebacteria-1]|jgi:iron complex transport system ATP-binding protein|nr:MAG: ABC transporter ATP-binding protein [Candidatus Riflebacteria bacterium HGW-Riflebacteria-1]
MFPISVENLSFAWGSHKILEDVSFSIEPGTVTSILGPNGSGKTTLLKILLGFLKPLNGRVLLNDSDLATLDLKARAKKMAYVAQRHSAVFSYRVIDVVALGRIPYANIFCKITDADYGLAENCLNQLGIAQLASRPYTEISGGEQQLVLIARALVQQAEILVMDEPVSGLDYGNQLMLLKQLRKLAQSGITCIKTTHYPEHALWTSDRAIFLRDGRIIASGNSTEIINSETLKELYNADIMVLKSEAGSHIMRTCVPIFD